MDINYYLDQLDKNLSMGEVAFIYYNPKKMQVGNTGVLQKIITSTILKLHLKKHLRLEDDNGQLFIQILESNNDLTKSEQVILDYIKKCDVEHDGKLTLFEITRTNNKIFIDNREKIKESILQDAIEHGFLDEKKLARKINYRFSSAIIIAISLICSRILWSFIGFWFSAVFFIFVLLEELIRGKNLNIYTEKCDDVREKIINLREFLQNNSLIYDKKVLEVYLWEDFLCYAVVLGLNEYIPDALRVNIYYDRLCYEGEFEVNFDVLSNKYYYIDEKNEKVYVDENVHNIYERDNRKYVYLNKS